MIINRNCADAIRYPSGKTLEQVFVGGNPLIVEQQLLNQDTYCFPSLVINKYLYHLPKTKYFINISYSYR